MLSSSTVLRGGILFLGSRLVNVASYSYAEVEAALAAYQGLTNPPCTMVLADNTEIVFSCLVRSILSMNDFDFTPIDDLGIGNRGLTQPDDFLLEFMAKNTAYRAGQSWFSDPSIQEGDAIFIGSAIGASIDTGYVVEEIFDLGEGFVAVGLFNSNC